jgi:hypothetical protein
MSFSSILPHRAAFVALFVVACATVPVALLTDGWSTAAPRDAVALEQAKGRLLLRTYGKDVAAALVPCPPACAYFAVFLLLLTPVASLVITAGRASDAAGRNEDPRLAALRELGVHTGHALAVLAASYALMGIWFAFSTGDPAPLDWMPRLFLVNAVYALPFVGLAAALRALTASAVTAVSAHCVVLGLLAVLHVICRVQGSRLAEHLPPAVDGLLLAGATASQLRGLGVALCWSVLFGTITVFGSIRITKEKFDDSRTK